MPRRSRRHFGSVISRPSRPGYYIRIRWAGVQRTRYSGPTKTLANEHLSRIHVALARGGTLDDVLGEILGPTKNTGPSIASAADAQRPTFAEVAERYMRSVASEKRESTIKEDRARLDVVLEAPWAPRPIAGITKGEIATWIDEIGMSRKGGKGLAPSTLNRYRSLVSVVFEHAVERDLVESNPARSLRRADESRRAREEYLTVDQFWAVFDAAPPQLKLMIAIGAHTGLRPGAIREIRWRHLELDAGTLLAVASYAKSAKPQLFHLDPAIVEMLRDMKTRTHEGAERVFLTETGVPWSKGWLCRVMRKTIDSCEAIPVEIRSKVTFYTLRHTFASLLEQDGLGEGKLQTAMAHSDPRLTRRYAHLGPDGPMKEIGKRMGRILKLDRLKDVHEGPRQEYVAG